MILDLLSLVAIVIGFPALLLMRFIIWADEWLEGRRLDRRYRMEGIL